MWDELATSGNLVALVLCVLSVLAGYFFGRRNRKAPALRYATAFTRLSAVSQRFGDRVSIAVDGKELDDLSMTELAVWHGGGDAIRRKDLVQSDPFRIEVLDGDEILGARVAADSGPAAHFAVTMEPEGCTVTFEFLDRYKGAVIEVLHRGSDPATLRGSLPGVEIVDAGRAQLDLDSRIAVRANMRSRLVRAIRSNGRINLAVGVSSTLAAALALGLFIIGLRFSDELTEALDPIPVDAAGAVLLTTSGFLALTAIGGIRTLVAQLRAVIPRDVVARERSDRTSSDAA